MKMKVLSIMMKMDGGGREKERKIGEYCRFTRGGWKLLCVLPCKEQRRKVHGADAAREALMQHKEEMFGYIKHRILSDGENPEPVEIQENVDDTAIVKLYKVRDQDGNPQLGVGVIVTGTMDEKKLRALVLKMMSRESLDGTAATMLKGGKPNTYSLGVCFKVVITWCLNVC